MQIFSSRRMRYEALAVLSLITAFSFYGYRRFSEALPADPQALASILGPYGPAGIVLTQFAQVLVAPIPPVTPVVSGMMYGVPLGTFYSFVGAALGSLTAILIARRYGRTAVERFLSDEAMEKFDEYTSGHGFLPFVVLFVFPGFPDDALCFIAGLTDLDWKKVFIIASVGRIPGIALLAMTGSSAAEANKLNFVLSGGAVALISLVSLRYEEMLEEYLAEMESETVALLEVFR
ncbi:MAG: TVP38/TMEM64 family protein [Candidatus Nanohaloarchaea archaeon]